MKLAYCLSALGSGAQITQSFLTRTWNLYRVLERQFPSPSRQWSLIQNQPLLKTIYLKPPTTSYKRDKSLKDTLVRSKI